MSTTLDQIAQEVRTSPSDPVALFTELFSPDALLEVFFAKFAESRSKGVDRINGFQFYPRAADQLLISSRKCLDGSYRFSPYLENLKSKGRGKAPRVIAIPTVRDRIVLHQLNKFIAARLPESVPRVIANAIVRDVVSHMEQMPARGTYVCGCDIKDFYGSIDIDRLLSKLGKQLACPPALALVRHALLTPTVSKNSRRRSRTGLRPERGVPQGLAISNILASIYVREVDRAMAELPISYFRYVDDVLLIGSEGEVRRAYKSFRARMRRRRLALHPLGSGKSQLGPMTSRFGYLGYTFQWPEVTVREETVERLLVSIAAHFSDFLHNSDKRLQRYSYLTAERLAEIFLAELNERITGAISEGRRYGWIAYYSQITDMTLLHRLDLAVRDMFSRLDAFKRTPPNDLKRFSRAYYEIKFNPHGGYVRDYDRFQSLAEKLKLLVARGKVSPDERLTDEQVESRFLPIGSECCPRCTLTKGSCIEAITGMLAREAGLPQLLFLRYLYEQ